MTNNQPASITMTEVQLQARIDAALKQQENALMALFQTKLAEVAAAQQPAPVAPAPVVEAPAVDPVVDLEKQDDVLKAEFQALGFAMVNAKTDADRKALAAKLSAVTNTRASIQSKIAHLTGAGLRGAADLTRSGINLSDMARKGLIAVVNGTFDGVNYVLNGTANVLDKAADYIDPEGARVEVIQPKTLPTLA